MRITVNPPDLRSFAQQLKSAYSDLLAINTRLTGSLSGLDWEASEKAVVARHMSVVRDISTKLSDEVLSLARYLTGKAEVFEDADRRGVEGIRTSFGDQPPPPLIPAVTGDPGRQAVTDDLRKLKASFDPQHWYSLSIEDRKHLLERAHAIVEHAYGVPAEPVSEEDLNDGFWQDFPIPWLRVGRDTRGMTYEGRDLSMQCTLPHIGIDEQVLRDSSPVLAFETIVHESRHVVQYYAIHHPELPLLGIDDATRKSWIDNYQAGIKGVHSPGYVSQALEVDARAFGEEVTTDIFGMVAR